MKARIYITLKAGVLDPQGAAVSGALAHLGFDGVVGLRQGKVIDIELAETDKGQAMETLTAMCQQLLANTVIEDYAIDLGAPKSTKKS